MLKGFFSIFIGKFCKVLLKFILYIFKVFFLKKNSFLLLSVKKVVDFMNFFDKMIVKWEIVGKSGK